MKNEAIIKIKHFLKLLSTVSFKPLYVFDAGQVQQ